VLTSSARSQVADRGWWVLTAAPPYADAVSTPATPAPTTTPATVLVVDDDPTVAEVVVTYLERAGLRAVHADTGASGLTAFEAEGADLVVLDLMLPDLDGLEVCRRLRSTSDVPVIMLTALGGEVDRVLGLEVGADDYVTKPFSPRELVLRVQSVLRRTGRDSADASPQAPDPVLRDADLVLDTAAHTATRGDAPLPLTSREFDLLAFLLAHPGRAFTRGELMEQVWGWSFGDQSTVTVHVRRLREKVEPNPTEPARLVTVWGVGYRWDATEPDA
jgi:DNA-binding response OmpR family regulator